MIPENDPIAISLNERSIEAKDRKYCDMYYYYISVARIPSRIRVKVPRGIEIPGIIPRVHGPDPAPELLPGRLIEYLFVRDGDADPISARIYPTVEHGLEKSRIKESLKLASQMKAALNAVSKQLKADIAELKKASA